MDALQARVLSVVLATSDRSHQLFKHDPDHFILCTNDDVDCFYAAKSVLPLFEKFIQVFNSLNVKMDLLANVTQHASVVTQGFELFYVDAEVMPAYAVSHALVYRLAHT